MTQTHYHANFFPLVELTLSSLFPLRSLTPTTGVNPTVTHSCTLKKNNKLIKSDAYLFLFYHYLLSLTLVDIGTHDTVLAIGSRRWIGAFDFWHVANHYS